MKPQSYHVEFPESMDEVLEMLADREAGARLIAGGTDILVDIRNGAVRPGFLVSVARVQELKTIELGEDGLAIGAGACINDIAASRDVGRFLPALSYAASSMASYPIRNIATIGGNICSAVPSADLPPVLIAAGASLLVRGGKGVEKKPLAGFFIGPRETVLDGTQVVTTIVIPPQPLCSAVSYKKLKLRGANALAVASVAARLTLEQGIITDAAVVLGAVAPVPLAAMETTAVLKGSAPSEELLHRASLRAAQEARPISDIRGSMEYRRSLVRVLTRQALAQALEDAKECEP